MSGGDAAVYELISSGVADVLVESTPLEPTRGEPATSYIRGALDGGLDVVTANKGPIAFAYQELRELAKRQGRQLRFETAVMSGAPIFSLFEFAVPLVEVGAIRGILNCTSNFVVSRMRGGIPEEMALAEAERLGIAEADTHHDLDGWDAALKLTILANVLMKGRLRAGEVKRELWPPPASTSVDHVWRQVAEARRLRDGRVTGSVHWVPLPTDDPFSAVDGTSMAVELQTDLLGKIMIGIADPTPEQAAYGLLADLLFIA
jgi:homoserine dehydrogenase